MANGNAETSNGNGNGSGALTTRAQNSHDNAARMIPDFDLGKIKLMWELNVRNQGKPLDPDSKDIVELAEDIAANGLLQNVVVQERVTPAKEGKPATVEYILAAGFRRYTALKKLGWKKVPVKCIDGGDLELKLANLRENLGRKDVRPYEVAVRCADLKKDYELSGKQIAERLGFSKSYVNNLIRITEKLAPKVLKAFSHNDSHESIQRFYQLASLPPEEQIAALDEWKAEEASAEEESAPKKGKGAKNKKKLAEGESKAPKMIRADKLDALIIDIERAEEFKVGSDWLVPTDADRLWLKAIAKYIRGINKTYPLRSPEADKAKAEKEAKKAEK